MNSHRIYTGLSHTLSTSSPGHLISLTGQLLTNLKQARLVKDVLETFVVTHHSLILFLTTGQLIDHSSTSTSGNIEQLPISSYQLTISLVLNHLPNLNNLLYPWPVNSVMPSG